MPVNKDQLRRKLAARLALADDTDEKDFQRAVSLARSLGNSDKDSITIATAMRNKFRKQLRAELKKEAEGILDIQGLFPKEFGNVDKDEDDRIDTNEGLETSKEPEREIEEVADEAEDAEDADEAVIEEPPVEPEKEPEIEFSGEAKEEVSLVPGEPLEIQLPDGDVISLSFETTDKDLNIEENVLDEEEPLYEDEPEPEENEINIGDIGDEITEEDEMPKEASKVSRKVTAKVEDVKPRDRNLGHDTEGANPKPFQTDGIRAVGTPGDDGATMTLKGVNPMEGENKTFEYFDVPTALLDERFLTHNAKGTLTLDSASGDLVDQFKDMNLDPGTAIPTQGGDKDFWGWDKKFENFEVPTQNPSMTKQRKTTADVDIPEMLKAAKNHVLNSKHAERLFAENLDDNILKQKQAGKICDHCNNEVKSNVVAVNCKECNANVVLCEDAYDKGLCPGCASVDAEAARLVSEAAVSNELTKDYGDEACVAEGQSITRDINGDGGFRVGKTEDNDTEKEVEASVEVLNLRQALKDNQLQAAREKAAIKAAYRLAQAGVIEEGQIEATIEDLMNDNTSVTALNHLSDQMVEFAKRVKANQIKESSVQTSNEPIHTGFSKNFVMASSQDNLQKPDMKELLSNVFTRPTEDQYDSKGRKIK